MKKILPVLILSVLLLPTVSAIAATTTYAPASDLEDAVNKIVNFFFTVLIIIAVVLFIWGGVVIVSSGGDAEKVTQGRNIILYAVVGLLIAFLAKGFAALLKGFIG